MPTGSRPIEYISPKSEVVTPAFFGGTDFSSLKVTRSMLNVFRGIQSKPLNLEL